MLLLPSNSYPIAVLFLIFASHISLGQRNDVALMGLNHKMGWRGTTNTALSFGENGQCTGYLIGKVSSPAIFCFIEYTVWPLLCLMKDNMRVRC